MAVTHPINKLNLMRVNVADNLARNDTGLQPSYSWTSSAYKMAAPVTALWALGEIESSSAVSVLAPALKDGDAGVRGMAAWALGEIESSAAVASLTPLLRDPEDEVRAIVAWALGEIESGSALPALEAAKEDRSPAVRRAVRWAIARIDDDRR
jgi:HEAT repeat protein